MVTIAVCLLAFLILGYSLGRSRWTTLLPVSLALYILLGTLFEGVTDSSDWVVFLGVASASFVTGMGGVMLREHAEYGHAAASRHPHA